MLTTATTNHLHGLISPTRTPWTGTIREALGDIEEERLVSLCETAGITITNEGDGVLDDDEMLAAVAGAGFTDEETLSYVFDDPGCKIMGA